MEFATAGIAAMGACVFSNPLEVLKTRMQLQGELQKKGHHQIHYKNVLHASYVIIRKEGVLSLNKGLVPALWVQLIMNGLRLGTYQWAENRGFLTDTNGRLVLYKNVLWSGFAGVLGQYFASPFFLVKTHMQSQAAKEIAVGHQHHHQNSWTALYKITKESGMKGLFRGSLASIPRAWFGSISQLLAFKYCKEFLSNYEYFAKRPYVTSFWASMAGGVAISVIMTPFELIMTRIYNQPVGADGKGLFYKSYMDCTLKIYQKEGMSAFYKGIGPMYLRLGPHTMLCLVFWDLLKDVQNYYQNK